MSILKFPTSFSVCHYFVNFFVVCCFFEDVLECFNPVPPLSIQTPKKKKKKRKGEEEKEKYKISAQLWKEKEYPAKFFIE